MISVACNPKTFTNTYPDEELKMKETLTILEDKLYMCLKIISLIHLIELYHNLFPICSTTVSIFKSCILILTTILMSVYDLPFFSGEWSWVDFSFPRIPGMQLFLPNMNRNSTHPFQDRSYMQLIGLFYVLFFLSAWLHAKDPLEIGTGRVTNCKCHMEDHQEYIANMWKVYVY